MKKYILPLILILILSFTLIGNCAWLAGWDQRVKLTTDETKIDTANLTWFPVTVFLTGAQAEEVFAEFDADADYLKVAFTKADGTTELYAECELFDDSESKGIYHVSRDGWVIAYDADTDFYMYYDNDHADNTDYIGAINTTAGGNVWDGNFKAVYHMVDDAGGEIDDSTSNNNDGTKKGAGEPASAVGKVGLGQEFDGSNDTIQIADSDSLDIAAAITIEVCVEPDAGWANYDKLLEKVSDSGEYPYNVDIVSSHWRGYVTFTDNTAAIVQATSTFVQDTWYHVVFTYDGTNAKIYVNGELETTSADVSKAIKTSTKVIWLGSHVGTQQLFDGIEDELKISSVARTVGWIKATYNSLWDTLLTYGSEESAVVTEGNEIFFGINF